MAEHKYNQFKGQPRLPKFAVPKRYDLRLKPDLVACKFTGAVDISVDVVSDTKFIVLNAAELSVDPKSVLFKSSTKVIFLIEPFSSLKLCVCVCVFDMWVFCCLFYWPCFNLQTKCLSWLTLFKIEAFLFISKVVWYVIFLLFVLLTMCLFMIDPFEDWSFFHHK